MKSTIFALIFTISIGALSSYPTSTSKNPERDDELFVPFIKHNPFTHDFDTDFKHFDGVIDTGVRYPSFNLNNLSFLDRLQDMIRQFREQTFSWPSIRPTTTSFGLDGLWSEATDKGNTTSTVEVIDGHKVIVNETVYKKHGDFGESIYKVRVVNILPVDQQDTVIIRQTDAVNTETIDKTTVDPFAIFETVDDVRKEQDQTTVRGTTESNINRREELEDHDDDDDVGNNNNQNIDDHIVKGSPELFDDSNLADNEISNDFETIESFEFNGNDNNNNNNHQETNDKKTDKIIQQNNNNNNNNYNLNFDFDSSEFDDKDHSNKEIIDDKYNQFIYENDGHDLSQITFKPIDLSNDINVNRMFADQQHNYFNPDAELIDIDNFNHNDNNNNNNYYNWNNEYVDNLGDSETENPIDDFKTY